MQPPTDNPRYFIAHRREANGDIQTLECHLLGVGKLAAKNARKLGQSVDDDGRQWNLEAIGEVLGLLHDFGKYSKTFQDYLGSAVGLIDQDADDYVDATVLRGHIDHSTAGAQFIWQRLSSEGPFGRLAGQVLGLCIASHHSGLIDCLTPSGDDSFGSRMNKPVEKTHLDEARASADKEILSRVEALLSDANLIANLRVCLEKIVLSQSMGGQGVVAQQQIGLLVRFLFSCLIDADRVDTADFEKPKAARSRMHGSYTDWGTLIDRFEAHLAALEPREPIDQLRADISRHCHDGASRVPGTYTLTVPTGGGKTLASLRFALHHANKWKMDRVIYVIPFTTIIDQNADVVRRILEPDDALASKGRIVLEHHGNLTPEQQGWREKVLSENWDAPVIYTTMVQFLETLFGAGTRGARRMHQLANAVIVFDEIQTLPINCVHLFNNAVNFLVDQCSSTVVLCTATQPLLDTVNRQKGAIRIPSGNELMPDVMHLFRELKRVDVVNSRKPGGWTNEDIAVLAITEVDHAGSCLVIVNTKASALALYHLCKGNRLKPVVHLSTSMCPTHRKRILRIIRHRLRWSKPMLCISTQLIEAGVDVDFGAVVRFTAGLDSIAQAAGRCNRNGRRETGIVHVVNPQSENLGSLTDIKEGRDNAERVLDDYETDPDRFSRDRIGPEAMAWYYQSYFFARASQMDYPVGPEDVGRSDSLLNLLSANTNATVDFAMRHPGDTLPHLRQSFMSAAKAFEAIDAPTRGIIVPYGKAGRELVADLCSAFEVEKQFELLKRAQQFTVNVFPNVLAALMDARAISPIQEGTEVLHLDPRYYSPEFGLSTKPVQMMEALIS